VTSKPIPESYWVVPERFLAGGYPTPPHGDESAARACLTAFVEAGFDTYFDLTGPGELAAYLPLLQEIAAVHGRTVRYQRVAVQDRGLPSCEQIRALLDAVDAALVGGRKVYVHCWGGVGRTGMAVGCWLARHEQPGQAALDRLAGLYRSSAQSDYFTRSPETDAQVKFVREWSG
jgi:hypothetical protein